MRAVKGFQIAQRDLTGAPWQWLQGAYASALPSRKASTRAGNPISPMAMATTSCEL